MKNRIFLNLNLIIFSITFITSFTACSNTHSLSNSEDASKIVSIIPTEGITELITITPQPTASPEVTKLPLKQEEGMVTGTVTPTSQPFVIDEEIALNHIKSYFEEPESRIFEITSTQRINSVDHYIITVTGKTDYITYPIDTFAVSTVELNTSLGYFLDQETSEYVQFFTIPFFACKTSPDSSLRIESIGMNTDGPSGLHCLREMRLIDTTTGNVLWNLESFLMNNFMWSRDGHYVSVSQSGRNWTSTVVIDTTDMSVTTLPGPDIISKLHPTHPKPLDGYQYIYALEWFTDNDLIVSFKWTIESGSEVTGLYEYNVLQKGIILREININ